MRWLSDTTVPDLHAAFRCAVTVTEPTEVTIALSGSGWWEAHLDGLWLEEGQPRYHPTRPEHVLRTAWLAAGRHVLAIHAHHVGVHTRLMRDLPPFVDCRIWHGAVPLTLRWRGCHLACYRSQVARINPQLGWCDWLDSRTEPQGWRDPGFDDAHWAEPALRGGEYPESRPTAITLAGRSALSLRAFASGRLAEAFGYELDDPSARFLLRELDGDLPPQGIWRRYDLGRVRLGRPRFTIDLPPGAVVEWALAEQVRQQRVTPFITLSAGRSCNFDHVIAHGGRQVFRPSSAKGGRFLELHVLAPPERVSILEEVFEERGYFMAPVGSFSADDPSLDAIWSLGAETLRACSEDAVVDNPTRERGQWTGDAVIALETASVAFGDLSLCRRALEQAAIDARSDGMISGLSPADSLGVTTYAMQWVGACVRYHELTGDRSLLEEQVEAAARCMATLRAAEDADGLSDRAGWGFVDWGYVRPPVPVDLAVNLHYLGALRQMAEWCHRLGDASGRIRYGDEASRLQRLIEGHLARLLERPDGWRVAGFHVAALVLRMGLLPEHHPALIVILTRHILDCFPNDPTAPRLSDPGVAEPRLITPFFAHVYLAALAEAGAMDFVLAQYKACWGWMLNQGVTTCLEVFDTRWSHCHQWSACPTWQLTRYLLGLDHCAQHGHNHLRLDTPRGSLPSAHGVLPVAGGLVSARWQRQGDALWYQVSTTTPIVLHTADGLLEIATQWSGRLPVSRI